jgi:hypothetical protein
MDIKKMKIYFKYAVIVLMVMAFGVQTQPDDKELFMGFSLGDTVVRPNVVILMDSSVSMNIVIFYPKNGIDKIENTADDGYEPNESYSGTVEGLTATYTNMSQTKWYARWQRNGNAEILNKNDLNYGGAEYWSGCYANDGTPNNFQCGDHGWDNFREGELVLFYDTRSGNNPAVAKITRKYIGSNSEPWLELEDIKGGPITPSTDNDICYFQQAPVGVNWHPVIVNLYGTVDHGQNALYTLNYIKWLFIHADDFHRDAVTHFSTWGTFDVTKEPPEELSNCATPGNNDLTAPNPRIKKTFTRIQTAREVVCKVAETSNQIVKLGLFEFTYENGGHMVEGLTDMSDEASLLVAYKNNVWDIYGGTFTPLAEALADIWYYYKPGPASKTYYPVDYEIDHSLVNHSVNNPVTPVDYWCQNNYVVLMTDGESTKDGFNDWGKYGNSVFRQMPVKRAASWEDWEDGWGDADNNDQNNGLPFSYNPNGSYCPNYTCWTTSMGGTDYLDDVAYFLNHQDMFPDDFFGSDSQTGWPGNQNILTYTIGFNADNHMLEQTAINGDGSYYTATNYEELVEAYENVITSINLRNFAFSSITAPRKTTTATNDELTISYVGYFLPSQSAPIWEGHLLAFKLEDQWGFDTSGDDIVTWEEGEFIYDTEEECLNQSNGKDCVRSVILNIGHEWDAAAKMPVARSLFTHNNTTTLINFDISSATTLQPLFGGSVTEAEAETIITKISQPHLADIFHSDVGFVGAPPFGKQFISNLNPTGAGDEKYEDYYNANQNRTRVLYAGTNDGVMHMFYADGINAGIEKWGFIPDEVLPSLDNIALDNEHTYTVDGRMVANDIYYVKPTASGNSWTTLMVFGLRRGGNAFYGMDITQVTNQPNLLWKFKDDIHSGQSWGKPIISRILIQDPSDITKVITKWVVLVPGGFAFNSENSNNLEGKAVFMLDAATGELIWKIAYDPVGGAADTPNAEKEILEVNNDDSTKHLTKSDLFNFSIPSALTAVDTDNDGHMDAIYFGNVGGNLFKTDLSNPVMDEWTTYVLYKTEIITKGQSVIDNIVEGEQVTQITASDKVFDVGDGIRGMTSYATAYIIGIENKTLSVLVTSGQFQMGEGIITRVYDPIFLSPTVAFDTCYQMWVAFGTGDRDRPRTNLTSGRFIILKDDGSTNSTVDELTQISVSSSDEFDEHNRTENTNGWYFDFTGDGEKLFDPEPIILPDDDLIPHIYFNSYRPPEVNLAPGDNPCDAPDEGIMTVYDLYISSCGTTDTIEGERFTGRIAGGGMYQGKEYVLYISKSGDVADVPGGEGGNFSAVVKKLPYPGGIVFWLEKRR